jgi:hypothetical protein
MWLVSFVFMLLIIIPILFYIFKDDISRFVLTKVAELQNGEITFQNVSFSPFVQFPNVSVRLDSLYYYEHPRDSTNLDELPIAAIEEIYIAVDVVDLIGGKINVPKITIDGGKFNIVTYPDSSVNLFNALGREKPGNLNVTEDITSLTSDEKDKSKKAETENLTSVKDTEFDLSINELTLQNLTLGFNNLLLNRSSSYIVNDLNASFTYREKRILSALNTDIDIENIRFPDRTYLTDKNINLSTSLSFDEEKSIVEIKPSRLLFENAQFDMEGTLGIGGEELIDIRIDGSDHDFSFFSLVLSEQGITNLERGDFYFNGTIKGSHLDDIPVFDFRFGVKDVDLLIPEVNERITGFNFSGYFNSGSSQNLSGANLF